MKYGMMIQQQPPLPTYHRLTNQSEEYGNEEKAAGARKEQVKGERLPGFGGLGEKEPSRFSMKSFFNVNENIYDSQDSIIGRAYLQDDEHKTTVMLRNIPNCMSVTMLMDHIGQRYRGMFDLVYLPIDFSVLLRLLIE